jgi:hypothetical protein
MKKISLALIIIIGISFSCTKDFEEFNTDKKNPTEVPSGFLFANSLKALGDQMASTNVNLNVFKLWAQYWTETTYTDEANYDIINRTIADLTFREWYRDVLSDLNDAKKAIEGEAAEGATAIAEKQNKLSVVNIVEVFCYMRLVDIFGNVPYTEACDIDNISPVYDDAATIYDDLLARLDNALSEINDGHGSFGGDDVFFHGDVAMWKKFANTLKVRIGTNLADVSGDKAKEAIEGAYMNAFAAGEICEIQYETGSMANPLYQDMVQSGRDDFVAANTIVDIMNNLNDPRRWSYFDTNLGEDTFLGGEYGESSAFSQYSHAALEIQEPDYPYTILDYTELCFYLAEAAARGYNVGGSAEEWYNNGIMASMEHWGVSTADAEAYMAQADVAWSTAPGDWKQKIAVQEWLAFYIRGLEGWTTWRRLDWPEFNLPPAPESDDGQVPKRFTYPVNEQTLNADNYMSASEAIGGGTYADYMSTKIFWDVN